MHLDFLSILAYRRWCVLILKEAEYIRAESSDQSFLSHIMHEEECYETYVSDWDLDKVNYFFFLLDVQDPIR